MRPPPSGVAGAAVGAPNGVCPGTVLLSSKKLSSSDLFGGGVGAGVGGGAPPIGCVVVGAPGVAPFITMKTCLHDGQVTFAPLPGIFASSRLYRVEHFSH